MSYAQAQPVPGPVQGTINIPGYGVVSVTDWREDNIWDAELLPVTIANGQSFTFFRNLAIAGVPKTRLLTNMITPSMLPYGQKAVVYGIHVMVQPDPTVNLSDAQNILSNGYGEFVTGDTKREKSGPIWMFQSPYGLTASMVADGHAAPIILGSVNNGIPSPAAIGRMAIPIELTNLLTFSFTLTFFNAITLFVPTLVYVVLRSFINTPVR